MDDIYKSSNFDRSETLDSEEILKKGWVSNYKEYEFESVGNGPQQQDLERKAEDLWRAIEQSEKGGLMLRETKDILKITEDEIQSPEGTENYWLGALRDLARRGLTIEAARAVQQRCKLCDYEDLGQIFADEAYEDRYIRPSKPTGCD